MPIDFPSWFPASLESWSSGSWTGHDICPIKQGTFLIGNHADEITVRSGFWQNKTIPDDGDKPWMPLLSLIPPTPVPHLSLPCCLHTLDGWFDRLHFSPPAHPHTPLGGFETGLEPGQSRYKAYLMWLGWCGLQCGWEWEKEGLRVPSTKGWGIVGESPSYPILS